MPELPEVETTCRGIAPHITGKKINNVIIRERRLRWPVPKGLAAKLENKKVRSVTRRGKYILIHVNDGYLILHLGMSGRLHVIDSRTPVIKHDHVDIVFANGKCLRFHDPRRFGSIHWTGSEPTQHKLLNKLGVEPLDNGLTAGYLYEKSRKRKAAIKQIIMDSHIVVGVGNIYASESLFLAGINPKRAAGKISHARYEKLVAAIKQVLSAAIKQGGTTLRDFTQADGKPGYFKQKLNVYGREGEACVVCGNPIKQFTQGQRATYYCSQCKR